MISYRHLHFEYEPFPYAVIRPVLDDSIYAKMLDSWPPLEWCVDLNGRNADLRKYSLDETNTKARHLQFVSEHPVWRDFHRYIKSEEFVRSTFEALEEHAIDLGYTRLPKPKRSARDLVKERVLRRAPRQRFPGGVTTRLQFSTLPGNGGCVMPHTDAWTRLATLVIYLVRPGEWAAGWGGALDINTPKNPSKGFNVLNSKLRLADVNVVRSIAPEPNQGFFVVKTHNSWHSVRPITAGPEVQRRSITISINGPARY